MRLVCVTGAGSFIGRHLLDSLSTHDDNLVKAMARDGSSLRAVAARNRGISIFEGDLLDPGSLQGFVENGCAVVNLAYLRKGAADDNLRATKNLLASCEASRIRRFIHCSTAVVVGRTDERTITEDTPCNPLDEYERTKLAIEKMVIASASGRFEYIILRPTAVFGKGGKNLAKLVYDLRHGGRLLNYAKACVFGRRRMNLVCVENLMGAIGFALTDDRMRNETFIVSDDEDAANNFRDVESLLARGLGCPRLPVPPIALPLCLLRGLLASAGRTNVEPRRIYDGSKLGRFGYRKPVNFLQGLEDFIESCRTEAGTTGSSINQHP